MVGKVEDISTILQANGITQGDVAKGESIKDNLEPPCTPPKTAAERARAIIEQRNSSILSSCSYYVLLYCSKTCTLISTQDIYTYLKINQYASKKVVGGWGYREKHSCLHQYCFSSFDSKIQWRRYEFEMTSFKMCPKMIKKVVSYIAFGN